MRWVLLLLAVAFALAVIGWVISALKALLLLAALLVLLAMIVGRRPGERSTRV
ncbi:MAG: hypothetical protein H0T17_03640 [Propionibacteriales bacterium]|nr:hypothetical protein [Propionibacteriales bacterium]